MIPKKIRRPASRAARMSLILGAVALAALITLTLLHKASAISTPRFAGGLITVFAAALAGLACAMLGFKSLWQHGSRAGKRSLAGLSLSMIALAPFLTAAYLSMNLPKLSDISTDLADPPKFSGSDAIKVDAKLQTEAFPNVTGRRYELSPARVTAIVDNLVREKGWEILPAAANASAPGETLIEARVTTLLFGFTDRVALRITDEGKTSFLDMRSASSFGDFDLGANAARISAFLAAADVLAAAEMAAQAR